MVAIRGAGFRYFDRLLKVRGTVGNVVKHVAHEGDVCVRHGEPRVGDARAAGGAGG